MKRLFFIFLLFFSSSLSLLGINIRIINDSIYTLDAYIYAADNTEVGSATILGNGHSYTWQDGLLGISDWTPGPFTVHFYCKNGTEYGKITFVASKITIYATAASGPKKCPSPAP